MPVQLSPEQVHRLKKTYAPDLDYGNIRASLATKNIEHPTAQQLRDVIIEIRNAKLPDPKVQGNAGSFFMNPIVEKAKYDDKQALVLVNRGGATGEEIVNLCETIRKDVRQKFGIDIHPEVNVK